MVLWDRIETNEFAQAVTDGMVVAFPQDPPRFLARTPHGYHDASQIRGELADAGFGLNARLEALEARSVASGPDIPAVAYCQGTPLRNEIEARDPALLSAATTLPPRSYAIGSVAARSTAASAAS